MAAGRGRRLGRLTKDFPKALIDVAGLPLIGHSLKFANWLNNPKRVVVGGFCYQDVENAVRELDPQAEIVENKDLHAGNLLSLVVGLNAIDNAEGFLVMNTDHIYPQGVADVVNRVISNATEVTAFCDFDRKLGADDMKVSFDSTGHVKEMSKTLTSWDGGYVGMTWIPKRCREAYNKALQSLRDNHGDDNPVEKVLVTLSEMKMPPTHADISGHGWHEIDEPHEREAAEAALKAK